jgi:ABC-type transport system involved in multi-copper enzyme maturation permease subunit
MTRILGPSPVLLYEALTASRRWQGYALRTLLILAILIALWLAWYSLTQQRRWAGPPSANQFMADLGEQFYYGVAGVLMASVLLVAPAATASAVCLDRERGWLAHMFVTELSDAEIVLGKLIARCASVVALVMAVVPVLAISTLLGGVSPEALVVLTITSLAVALMGCSLALALSVRAAKTHEVLMLVFALWGIWLMAYPIWLGATKSGIVGAPPDWFIKLNPLVFVYAPYVYPTYINAFDMIVWTVLALLVSAGAVFFAIRTLRKDLRGLGERSPRVEAARRWIKSNLFSWWPTPSLDGNPVLWREWHRNRPSRMARLVSVLFMGGTVLGTAIGIADSVLHGTGSNNNILVFTSLIAVTFGLLLLSATAPTTLTEERVRGSLDILMSTPIPTYQIVLGKWWATYRRTLPMIVLPALAGLFVGVSSLDYPSWLPARMYSTAKPITTADRVIAGVLPAAFFLVHSAAVTSLGLALATWLRRTGLAVAVSVMAFVVMSIGWVFFVESALRSIVNSWQTRYGWWGSEQVHSILQVLTALSPMGGQVTPLEILNVTWDRDRAFSWEVLLVELGVVAVVALLFLGLTLLSFNRCMGRMNESPEVKRYLRAARLRRERRHRAIPHARPVHALESHPA